MASVASLAEMRFNIETSLRMLLDGSMQTESDVKNDPHNEADTKHIHTQFIYLSLIS